MKTSKFDAWINKIRATETEEISCSDCLELLPEFVEGEIFGNSVQLNPKVKQHLHQCQVCQEEFEILRDLVRMDSKGQTPSSGE